MALNETAARPHLTGLAIKPTPVALKIKILTTILAAYCKPRYVKKAEHSYPQLIGIAIKSLL
ncbi:hypothetical protein DGMP_24330 [Desulfomarina profundi]|uniref:Uncharacterized protein n=1 Tax=Desulfomarina profundi TaxID=2772557 RepID=A0A8D5FQ80_9BACT|nr:hypothetical protein DGMP_24330 [Desulfomarina profundi]